ncbi:MAG TPA: hypothetical protein PLG23_09285 [Thermoflexales bacterium]|nr:hypothetical protein [Anaerolineae bacterium]HQV28011.1 hypothetical protein [Thermoflexales bacterium]HQX10615.1 hypothetical protein [Thermoflexales bacterium]HQY23744.1 hypothetical protein [Thermoflexales bacterium]HQZ53644.1 hypothetical protein [Thermoflexales bacterium]
MRNTRSLLRRLEGGASITAQATLYISVLFACFALVYDMGNVAMVGQMAQSAALIAAEEAAKEVSTSAFKGGQQIHLGEDALARAAEVVAGMLPVAAQGLDIGLREPGGRSVIEVSFRVRASTPILRACFGLQGIDVPVRAAAEPVWGAEGEWR